MSVTLPYSSPPPVPDAALPVNLDVGGRHYRTTTSTLSTLPATRLGKIAQEAEKNRAKSVDLFFDRNPQIVNSLLDLYRTGKLHLPEHMCVAAASEELRFWEIPRELLQDCCWKRLESQESDEVVVAEIDRFLEDPYARFTRNPPPTWRMAVWMVLEGSGNSVASKVWSFIFFLFILLSVMTSAFETIMTFRTLVDTFKGSYPQAVNWSLGDVRSHLDLAPLDAIAISLPRSWLLGLRYSTFIFFVADFLLRLLVCPARRRFFCQARNWLEIFIALQSCVFFVMESSVIPRKVKTQSVTQLERQMHAIIMAFASVRAFRIFYMAKNFDYMKIIVLCAKSSVKELLMLILCVLSFTTIFGTIAYTAEVLDDLNTFPSILSGMWWALITMTTVGYGDVYPVSVGGKVVGSICALSGLIVVAMPIAVIASKFSVYHSNLSPRQQGKDRAAFLKDNPQFDLGRRKEVGQGQGQGRGHDGRGKGSGGRKGEGKGRWEGRGCWGQKCKVDVVSLSEDVSEPAHYQKM
ncbi:hypothetical protein ACOMHN_044858 [Nucella lapillus]